MKFTKEQAVQDLTAKFTDKAKGIDLVRTINEAVDNCIAMVGENSEMELNDFVAHAEKFVSTSLGLARHENSKVATSLQEKIAELQKQIGGQQTTTTTEVQTEVTDPTLKALLEKVTKLEANIAKGEREQTIAEKRKQLAAKMGESIKDKDWIDSYLAEITITEETDVEAKAKDYIAFYNKTNSGGGRTTPIHAGGGDTTDKEVKNTLDKAKAILQQRAGIIANGQVKTETTV